MHPTLLIGPADWDPVRFPRAEYSDRIAALWQACGGDVAGAIVFGNPHDHAELAYLTHFTPKLEAALAVVPRAGEPVLLVGGGANMLGAAKPLTFVDKLAPLRDAGNAAAAALGGDRGRAQGRPVLIGQDHMPAALRAAIGNAFGGTPPRDASAELWTLMRRKSAREVAAVREACATLDAVAAALTRTWRADGGAGSAMLEAERAANRRGAQDVRTLFSPDGRVFYPDVAVDAGGGSPIADERNGEKTPLPKGESLPSGSDPTVDAAQPRRVRGSGETERLQPLTRRSAPTSPFGRGEESQGAHVYVAVRQFGYWADGFVSFGRAGMATGKARDGLRTAIGGARAGVPAAQLSAAVAAAIAPCAVHPLTAGALGHSIGLALAEPGPLTAAGDRVLAAGEVIALQVGAVDAQGRAAIVSAMIAVQPHGAEVLWTTPTAEEAADDRP